MTQLRKKGKLTNQTLIGYGKVSYLQDRLTKAVPKTCQIINSNRNFDFRKNGLIDDQLHKNLSSYKMSQYLQFPRGFMSTVKLLIKSLLLFGIKCNQQIEENFF